MSATRSIPQPPTIPIVGNLSQLKADAPTLSLLKLSEEYGPIFRMEILGNPFLIVTSQELVNELSDPTRFEKDVKGPLEAFREFAGDGLFTAYNHEPNWGKAHRVLMPAFGPIGVRDMFEQMLDIASQMFTRWERFGPDTAIDVSEDMTRLTLDTIALCGFGYRFNSFYKEELHPFVNSMVGALREGMNRTRRPKFISDTFMREASAAYYNDIETMRTIGQDLIDRRRNQGPSEDGFSDLLSRMLWAKDPETGDILDDENIAYQMITFLIAGHETTSATLSFAVDFLLRNQDILNKARIIVDSVLGTQMPKVEHLQELRYIEQIIMETLRHWPPAPAFAMRPLEPTTLAGKYDVHRGDSINILIAGLHRDKNVWGEDPEIFNPDNFAPGNAEKLPPNAWKPFGNGARACIGRPFAMQEAQLALSMMIQRFDFEFDDPNYKLEILDNGAVKPKNLRIRARARQNWLDQQPSTSSSTIKTKPTPSKSVPLKVDENSTPLLIGFGSNAGSSEAFAKRIEQEAITSGFNPTLLPLDKIVDQLQDAKAVIIVTASYEGEPPDNAKNFVPYIENLPPLALESTTFSVFGCGNRQWARTFQAIPKRIDSAMAAAGAKRIHALGEGDSGGDFYGAFDDWLQAYWKSVCTQFNKAPPPPQPINVDLSYLTDNRIDDLGIKGMQTGIVTRSKNLVNMSFPSARAKHHLEITLPSNMSYKAGDYLAVLARNDEEQTNRVLRRFGLLPDTIIELSSAPEGLPTERPITCRDLLTNYVELAQPATRRQVVTLAQATRCPTQKATLSELAEDKYDESIIRKRVSTLDLLERYQACTLTFEAFIGMLPTITPREYSISSSPLVDPTRASLTIAHVDAPAWSGHGHYTGLASSYLAKRAIGDRVSVAVKPGPHSFCLPEDPLVPVVMICAGSGFAPFRGFLQERANKQKNRTGFGAIMLFFGVDHPDCDILYKEELRSLENDKVIKPYFAFSEKPEGNVKFVQHRLWAERATIMEMINTNAKFLVCGDGELMEPAVRKTLHEIYTAGMPTSPKDAQKWFETLELKKLYVSDVFN